MKGPNKTLNIKNMVETNLHKDNQRNRYSKSISLNPVLRADLVNFLPINLTRRGLDLRI